MKKPATEDSFVVVLATGSTPTGPGPGESGSHWGGAANLLGITSIAIVMSLPTQPSVEASSETAQTQHLQEIIHTLIAHDSIDQTSLLLHQLWSLSGGVTTTSERLWIVTGSGQIRMSLTEDNPVEMAMKAFDRLRSQFHILYSDQYADTVETNEALDFLNKLFSELVDTLTNPEELANILAEVAIISPGLYICWESVKRIKQFAEKRKNGPIHQISSKCQKLLFYFEQVPKSRIGEISLATGISIQELQLLLHLLCFIHEPNCFWQPPLLRRDKR